jgi:hypothetical protein
MTHPTSSFSTKLTKDCTSNVLTNTYYIPIIVKTQWGNNDACLFQPSNDFTSQDIVKLRPNQQLPLSKKGEIKATVRVSEEVLGDEG